MVESANYTPHSIEGLLPVKVAITDPPWSQVMTDIKKGANSF